MTSAPRSTFPIKLEIFMKNQIISFMLTAAGLIVATQLSHAQSTAVPADNSKSNQVEPSNRTATADDQKDNESDRTLTQQIRKSVMADKALSTYGHNVKIVSVNGTVTLNGVVRSDKEKKAVERKAVAVAGKEHVVNELKVTPPN